MIGINLWSFLHVAKVGIRQNINDFVYSQITKHLIKFSFIKKQQIKSIYKKVRWSTLFSLLQVNDTLILICYFVFIKKLKLFFEF